MSVRDGVSDRSGELVNWVTSIDRAYTLQSGLTKVANLALSKGFSRDKDALLLFNFLLEAEVQIGREQTLEILQQHLPEIQSKALHLFEAGFLGAEGDEVVGQSKHALQMMLDSLDFQMTERSPGFGDIQRILRGIVTYESTDRPQGAGTALKPYRLADNERLIRFLTVGQTFASHAFVGRFALDAIPHAFSALLGRFER